MESHAADSDGVLLFGYGWDWAVVAVVADVLGRKETGVLNKHQ